MHELSIAQSIVSIAGNAAPSNPGTVVTRVNIEVGELSGIEVESLKFALSVIKNDSILKDAEFEIKVISGEAECLDCKTVFPMHVYGTPCPSCHNYFSAVKKGKEMKVVNIMVEENEEAGQIT